LGGLPVDSRVKELVNSARPVFESLGSIVDEAEPDFTGADETFKTLRAWAFAVGMAGLEKQLLKDTIQWEVERGERLTAAAIGQAEMTRTELCRRMRQFMERYEFFVLPVSQVPPFDVNEPYVTEIDGVAMRTYIDWMKSCYYISTVGNPALSVPCGFTSDGLPVGLQIVARHHDDWGLLQIGHAFEQARGENACPTK
jgi:amidase